jgi:hypothetical protein
MAKYSYEFNVHEPSPIRIDYIRKATSLTENRRRSPTISSDSSYDADTVRSLDCGKND